MTTTDDHFLIGSDHVLAGKPCQDHALSGKHGAIAYAVVSDGCSSGGHTDIGARFISLSLSAAIREHAERDLPVTADDLARTQEERLRTLALASYPISISDLLATCVYLCLNQGGGFASVRGDGVVASKWDDGSILLHRFDWTNNTPFYPAYLLESREAFVRAHGADDSAQALSEEVWICRPSGEWKLVRQRTYSTAQGIGGITLPFTQVDGLEYAAVFTDGVTQVAGVDWKEAVRELLAFKSPSGAFAKRRMIRFVGDARKAGKGPLDDIAYAVIRLAQEEAT